VVGEGGLHITSLQVNVLTFRYLFFTRDFCSYFDYFDYVEDRGYVYRPRSLLYASSNGNRPRGLLLPLYIFLIYRKPAGVAKTFQSHSPVGRVTLKFYSPERKTIRPDLHLEK
jgi:hypothetical protein